MFPPRVKTGVFVLEGVNAFSTSLYFNYLFFLMHEKFGFTNFGNLTLCALVGLLYTGAAWVGGQFAQRYGYFYALRVGFFTMAATLLAASQLHTVAGQITMLLMWTLGPCLTWPALEAIVSEKEPPASLQRLIGIYNIVWAVTSGLATFVGGALIEKLGHQSTFLIPAGLHLAQLFLAARLQARCPPHEAIESAPAPSLPAAFHQEERRRSVVPPETFLKMAWVANPFSYIAINAIIPVIPRLAEQFNLSPMFAGFFCSVWFFSRAAGFALLWQWTGWHYRFRWLIGTYAAMAVAFVVILAGGSLWVSVLAQVVFGLGVALTYYSSLYYSMDVGDTKGEHGGFHEAAIGAGICVGPAVGAASLRFFPQHERMNVWAVALLLTAGLAWLLVLRWRKRRE